MHTGQHHDDELSTIFVTELGVPRPERELGIHGGTNTEQTARMLAALGPLVAERAPRRRPRLRRHELDAGRRAGRRAGARAGRPRGGRHALVRSRDARGAQPRAHRPSLRRAAVPLADGGRQPRARARRRADRARGRRDGRRGAALRSRARAPTTARCARRASAAGEYALATAHRAGNVDDPARLRALVDLLLALPLPVVLPLHPRTRARLEAAGWLGELEAAAHVRLLAAAGLRRLHRAARRAPARCSPTRAACRRRPTWRACRA